MRKLLLHFLCGAVMVGTLNAFATDCVNCGPSHVSGMPKNSTFDAMERIAGNELTDKERHFIVEGFCLRFSQIRQELVGATIMEMEKTPILPEVIFTEKMCQPTLYSDAVKNPVIHRVAEDITKRQEFLQNIWLYYSRKRKQPEIFDQIINSKNTLGETLLDYLETMRSRGLYDYESEQIAYKKVITLLCSRGAVYSVHKNKKCS